MEVNGRQFVVTSSGIIRMEPKHFVKNLVTLMEGSVNTTNTAKANTTKMLLKLDNAEVENLSTLAHLATTNTRTLDGAKKAKT